MSRYPLLASPSIRLLKMSVLKSSISSVVTALQAATAESQITSASRNILQTNVKYKLEVKFMVTPGRVAEWLTHRTHNPMNAGLSLTGARNILKQDMNPVNVPQCCPSRGRQCVAPVVDLGECTLHLSRQKSE